jgi:hypothetical protein
VVSKIGYLNWGDNSGEPPGESKLCYKHITCNAAPQSAPRMCRTLVRTLSQYSTEAGAIVGGSRKWSHEQWL